MHHQVSLPPRLKFRCHAVVLCRLFVILSTFIPAVAQAQQPPGGGTPLGLPPKPPTAANPSLTPADTRFQSARLLNHPAPGYPVLAQLNRIEGVVSVRFGIDDHGHVTAVSLARSGGSIMLDDVVRDGTLQTWTFEPATLDGKPIASALEREVEFRLDPAEQRQLAAQRMSLQEGLPEPPYPPEAVPRQLKGTCTIGVTWTSRGLVNLIYLDKGSGSNFLDQTALRWVFSHWKIDPKNIVYPKDKDGKDKPFTKAVTFTPPGGAS